MPKHTRVIAFFHDKNEYKNEFKLFTAAAQKLVKRDDLRIAYVTDKNLVKSFKQQYGPKFFDEFSLNSIVLEYTKGHFVYYDIEKDT